MRIINGNRSPNALVWYQLPFQISVLEDDKLTSLKAFLDGYAKLHPHKWHSCAYCRADNFYPDIEKVVVTIGFQARSSWQDYGGLLSAKSELVAATIEYGRKQRINYEELPKRQLQYKAGVLRKGAVSKFRAELHDASNMIPMGDQVATKAVPFVSSGLPFKPEVNDDTEMHELSPNALFLSRLQGSHA